MKKLFAFAALFIVVTSCWGQNVEEIVVTGARTEEGAAMPGTFLRKTGDSVKTKIPQQGANGQALISKLKDFVSGIKVTGRTKLDPDGGVDISIVAPHRYRAEIISLFAQDAKSITSALGEDYKIVATGIDRPVRWVRMGLLELALFVPYKFEVLPSTVNTFVAVPRE